jgi:hypothetical protein
MPFSIRTIYRTKYYKPCADLFVLNDLNVAAFAGLFEAEEHGALAIEHHGI